MTRHRSQITTQQPRTHTQLRGCVKYKHEHALLPAHYGGDKRLGWLLVTMVTPLISGSRPQARVTTSRDTGLVCSGIIKFPMHNQLSRDQDVNCQNGNSKSVGTNRCLTYLMAFCAFLWYYWQTLLFSVKFSSSPLLWAGV